MLSTRYRNDGVSLLFLDRAQRAAKRSVERKVEQGVYTFESVRCAVCDCDDFDLLSEKDRCGLYAPVVLCRVCGLVQASPRMSAASFRRFYNEEYRLLQQAIDRPSQAFASEYKRGVAIHRYLQEARALPAGGGLIVEVGCGSGGILAAFRDRGCTVRGVDLDASLVEHGRSVHGLDLVVGVLADAKPEPSADVVIYSHVLEHVTQPKDELALLATVLSERGVVYVEVPGIKHLSQAYEDDFLRYLQNAHVYHFSLRTLRNLMERNGFELVVGDERVCSLFRRAAVPGARPAWQSDTDDARLSLQEAEVRRQQFHWKRSARDLLERTHLLPLVRRARRLMPA